VATPRLALSVVIPVRNEGPSVAPLMRELAAALSAAAGPWEAIWVDDGSTDQTLAELRAVAAEFPQVRVLSQGRPGGQSAALWAGLAAARGAFLATLDGDGQNDPADLPRLVAELGGADLVIGHRRRRRDPLAKRLFSAVANRVRNVLTRSRIPDSGCSLRVFRREVLPCLIPFDGMHRFVPTMAEMAGWRVASLEVAHRPRRHGRSKYGIFDRMVGPLVDCLMLRRLGRRRLAASDYTELTPTRPEPAECRNDRTSRDVLLDV
jgi:dolichol-phosphate mannosyltransferase